MWLHHASIEMVIHLTCLIIPFLKLQVDHFKFSYDIEIFKVLMFLLAIEIQPLL